jgi:hypothetical protein
MTKYDKILIWAVLTFAVFSYLIFFLVNQDKAPLTAQISVNGSTVAKIDLNSSRSNRLINISGHLGTSIVEVKPGAIRMKFSPCPDKYCMETGWIDQPGQIIACIPNRIIIKISPDKNSVDSTVH